MLHNVEVAQLKHKNLTQAELPLRLTKSKNDLQAAEQKYRLAKKNAKSMKDLLKQGFTKRREYEQAKAAINESAAELDLAKQQDKLLREMTAPGEIRQSELKLVELKRKVSEQKKVNQYKSALKNAVMIRLNYRYDVLPLRCTEKVTAVSKSIAGQNNYKSTCAGICRIQNSLRTG